MKNKFSLLLTASLTVVLLTVIGCKPKQPANSVDLMKANASVKVYGTLLSNKVDSSIEARRMKSFYYSAEIFEKADLEALLAESGSTGIRIYHGIDSATGRNVTYAVGVSDGKIRQDLLPKKAPKAGAAIHSDEYFVIDGNVRCQTMCDNEGLGNQ